MTNRTPFPVLCDRCAAEGVAGEAEFERLAGLGDLLDFEPVPRRVARADGWTPEIQRAYVAALAVTGSERQAAAVVERAAYGVTQLRNVEGHESFVAACDTAMEIYQERERVRRSDNLLAAAQGEAARTRGRPRLAWSGAATRRLPPPPEAPPGPVDADKLVTQLLEVVALKYFNKLGQERQARLEGRIAEADFYVRQITCLEVSLDMVSGDGMAYLRDFRCRGHDLLHIAETELSRLLDEARRLHWEQCGEPRRPEPPRHLLIESDGVWIEPLESTSSDGSGDWRTHRDQQRRQEERNARDAEAQIRWEAEAREAAAAWRARLEAEESARIEGEQPPAAPSADAGDDEGQAPA